jgi:hypothetical protein
MNIVDLCEAVSLSIQSVEKKGKEQERLFSLCQEKFSSAISSVPDDYRTLTNYGKVRKMNLW